MIRDIDKEGPLNFQVNVLVVKRQRRLLVM